MHVTSGDNCRTSTPVYLRPCMKKLTKGGKIVRKQPILPVRGLGARSACFILKQPTVQAAPANKREVKTVSFSPPGVGGVLHDNTLGGPAGLPCQAGLRPHSRTACGNSLGDSPPKSLSFSGL